MGIGGVDYVVGRRHSLYLGITVYIKIQKVVC